MLSQLETPAPTMAALNMVLVCVTPHAVNDPPVYNLATKICCIVRAVYRDSILLPLVYLDQQGLGR